MAVAGKHNKKKSHKNEDHRIAVKKQVDLVVFIKNSGCQRLNFVENAILHVTPPRFQLLDLGAEVSSFFAVLADFAFIVLYLLALPLQLVDEVVFDDGQSGCRVVCQCLHHYSRSRKEKSCASIQETPY